MKNILLKCILVMGCLLYMNSVFASSWCWPWDNCSGGDMNISIKNDTNYILWFSSLSQHNINGVTLPVDMLPGEVANIFINLPGDDSNAANASISFNVSVSISQDSHYTEQIDNITQSMHRSSGCDGVGSRCGSTRWKNLDGSHSWYLDPKTGLAPPFLYGISLNISAQGNNTYVYDYTNASNNPTKLPSGSNPWGNTEYAPSPYQNN